MVAQLLVHMSLEQQPLLPLLQILDLHHGACKPTVCFATRVFTFSLDALVSLFQDEFEMHHVVS